MDPHYEPKTTAGKIKIGDNILEQLKEDKQPIHTALSEPVKQGASVYSISQAFQTGLPGINT